MQRVARMWRTPFGIGLGYGLVAGLVGVARWVLTLRDLAERLAAFYAAQQQQHSVDMEFSGYWKVVAPENYWFWVGTASLAAVAVLGLCWRAAFTTSRARQRRRAGVMAALVAAAVSGAMYVAATPLVVATSPAPDITQTLVPGSPYMGTLFFIAAIFLARAGADKGARAGVSRRRRAE
jgi:hypothetical protein